jgi:hypothetical protein
MTHRVCPIARDERVGVADPPGLPDVGRTAAPRDGAYAVRHRAVPMGWPQKGLRVVAPLIAIVGSVDPGRSYDVPLRRVEGSRSACAEIGAALAESGCHLIVYSSDEHFIEGDFIRGYCASGNVGRRSIEVRFPADARIDFPELASHADAFHLRRDMSRDWETSYYRSLVTADGIVMVGGGQSTLIGGLIAVSQRIPLVPVATFGGAAESVWQHFDRDRGFTSPEDLEAMSQEWAPGSATLLVGALLAQVKARADAGRVEARREDVERRATLVSFGLAVILLVGAAATVPLAWEWMPGSAPVVAALVFAPLATGVAGALMRVTFDVGRDWLRAAVLGLGAGFVTNLLFLAAQLTTTPDFFETDGVARLLFFVLPIGFIAGFTFDVVYKRLHTVDVVRTDVVAAPASPKQPEPPTPPKASDPT